MLLTVYLLNSIKRNPAKDLMKNNHFDFILASGDNKTDESLLRILPGSANTIRVGISPSAARYNISDFSDFVKFLKTLVN